MSAEPYPGETIGSTADGVRLADPLPILWA